MKGLKHSGGKVAIIDVGSNTIKVLCAKNNDQRIKKLGAKSIEARLGGDQRVEGNWLEDESRKAAIRAILDLQDFALNYEVEKIEIVATSAVRDASNQDQFLEEVAHEAASPLRVLSEKEEATLIGRGIACDPYLPNPKCFCALDIGGGSLECIKYQDRDVTEGVSLPIGAVRLAGLLKSKGKLPINEKQIRELKVFVSKKLQDAKTKFLSKDGTLIGCGGAFSISRAILAYRSGVKYEDFPVTIAISDLAKLFEELRKLRLEDRCKIPCLSEGRADILPVALLVLMTVAEEHNVSHFHHSQYNLRFGLAATSFGYFNNKV